MGSSVRWPMPIGARPADASASGSDGASDEDGVAHTDADVHLNTTSLSRYLSHKRQKTHFMGSVARLQRGHTADMARLRTQNLVLAATLVLLALAWCISRYMAARAAYRHVYDALATPAFMAGRGATPGFSAQAVFLAAEFPVLYALSGGSALEPNGAAFLALAIDRLDGLTQLHWSGPGLHGRAARFCANYAEWSSPANPFGWLLPTEGHFATSAMARCKQLAPESRTAADWLFEGGLCAVARGHSGTDRNPTRILADLTGQFTVLTKQCPHTKTLVATHSVIEVVGAGATSLGVAGSFGLALFTGPGLIMGAVVVGATTLVARSRGADAYASASCEFQGDEVQLSDDTYMRELDCG
jgi:hypothetical protein